MTRTPARLFPTHAVREVCPLDGTWEYYFPRRGTELAPADWRAGELVRLPVPAAWESRPALVNYRGQAVARREIVNARSGAARLVFRGVSHTAEVFLDGRRLGAHHNAYTPFALDIPELPAGAHELLVHITNEFGELSALHVPNDYYTYGGIIRPVELQLLRARAYIVWVHCVPERAGQGWRAKLQTRLRNLDQTPCSASLTIAVAGRTVTLRDLRLPPGDTTVTAELEVGTVEPWAPGQPHLYPLRARLAAGRSVVDDWLDRVGFRTVSCQDGRLCVNDEPVFLLGFNRHEDHPRHGCALPLSALRRDVALLQELGANAVRTSHYPNDERFLDLCDAAGLMVWEENHARGLYEPAQMLHPRFREQCRACNAEMVAWHFNHPSIVLWGILNECGSHLPEGRAIYAEQFAQLRQLDPSRPVTYASFRHSDDICQDLPDVCGWNMYSNWYGNSAPAPDLDALITRFEPRGMKGKPLIISEFGGGALPGYHDPYRRAKWSEERQADVLRECLDAYLAHPRVTGVFIWQFCDIRVDQAWALTRPRTMNNKGVLDERRRPKMAAALVREYYRRGSAAAARDVPPPLFRFPTDRFRCLTPGPGQWFFGYYDVPAFSPDGQRHLVHRVAFRDRLPDAGDEAEVGWIELESGAFHRLGTTRAWNFQQGAMLQWRGQSGTEIFFNTVNESGDWRGVVVDLQGRVRQQLDRPLANLSRCGRWGLSINFARLFAFRPGYGYAGPPDPFAAEPCPEADGVFLTDVDAGRSRLIISLRQAWALVRELWPRPNAKVLVNHITFNPSATRFVMLLRDFPDPSGGGWTTAILTANRDGTKIRLLRLPGYASHYAWTDDRTLLFHTEGEHGTGLYEMDALTGCQRLLDPGFFRNDGHCNPSPDGAWILYDGYPDETRRRPLMLYHRSSAQGYVLGRLASPDPELVDLRCDLHPRWNADGSAISFDAIHEGARRVYMLALDAPRRHA